MTSIPTLARSSELVQHPGGPFAPLVRSLTPTAYYASREDDLTRILSIPHRLAMGPSFPNPRDVIVIRDDSDDDELLRPHNRNFEALGERRLAGVTAPSSSWAPFTGSNGTEQTIRATTRPTGTRVSNLAWTRQMQEQGLFIDLSDSEVEDPSFEGMRSPEIKPPTPEALVTDPAILYQDFEDKVKAVFPNICPKFLQDLYDARVQAFGRPKSLAPEEDMSAGIILHITDLKSYPTEDKGKRKTPKRKRRREESSDEEAKEWTAPGRLGMTSAELYEACKALQNEFETVPHRYILQQLKAHRTLYEAYRAIEAEDRNSHETAAIAFQRLKKPRKPSGGELLSFPNVKRELEAVRRRRDKEEAIRQKTKMEAEADAARDKKAFNEGDTMDCQCCFTETPSAKLTHCDADEPHFFCLDCAASNAKAQIDFNRYKLKCMDSSDCQGEFPRRERPRFLDEDTIALLDRLQQQTELREAEVEDLEQCPFCDFAAICPPKTVDKEFRCLGEDCSIVSCRLCRQESHIPKTCAEYKREQGVDERHIVEESMTEALLRRCPKCKVPIIKDGGCNKLACSQCGCKVCDVCGKDITKDGYNHFMRGSCPQVDDHVGRDQQRIEEAEKKAREKIRADNPDLSEEDLQIKFSDAVQTRPQALDPYGQARHHAYHQQAMGMRMAAMQHHPDNANRAAPPNPNAPVPPNLYRPPMPDHLLRLPQQYGPPQPYDLHRQLALEPPGVGDPRLPIIPPPYHYRGQALEGGQPDQLLLQPQAQAPAAGNPWTPQAQLEALRRTHLQRARVLQAETAQAQQRL